MPEVLTTMFPADVLSSFSRGVFESLGVPDDEAALAAEVLHYSDISGIDSHGIARLRTYVDLLQAGRINPTPKPSIARERASVATFDGDNGLGLVVGPRANALALDKAAETGSGWVSVCHTNHFGAAGYYITETARLNYIGWAMTNTTRIVTPLWGAQRMLGTNPIAVSFPAATEPPIICDFASCAAAFGKVEIALRHGKDIPRGWAIDASGDVTTDPAAMVDGGALLPLGSFRDQGGHKGYCLAIIVDLLCGALSGANWGPFCPPFALQHETPDRSVGKGIGHFFGAMDIGGFIDPDEFRSQVDDFIHVMRSTQKAPDAPKGIDGPLIPGDPERAARAEREANGVPIVQAVVEDLEEIARLTGVRLV